MAGTVKKVLTYGCFGCLGVIVVCLLVGAIMFGVAYSQVDSEEITEQSIVQELPAVEPLPPETELEAGVDDTGQAGVPGEATGQAAALGRVELDLANAEFEIEPGAAGEPIRVEARYDTNSYALEQSFDANGAGNGVFLSTVSFRQTGSSSFVRTIREALSGNKPRVQIWLPPDVPIDLELRIEQGGAQVELGGLWLVETELRYKQGGVMVDIHRPLRAPMQHLLIRGEMGGGEIGGVGNASPRELDVSYKMGGMVLDLNGQWQNDAEVSIDGRMGGGVVLLPDDDVTVVGVPGATLRQPDQEELPGPTLRFDVSSQMGDIDFVR